MSDRVFNPPGCVVREWPNLDSRLNKRTIVGDDWCKRVVTLWTEDDCTRHDPDAENADQAFERITGNRPDRRDRIARFDGGDSGYYLYRNGWVIGWACDGGSVGKLTEVEIEEV